MCFHHSTGLYLGDGWRFLFTNTIIFFGKEMWKFSSRKRFHGKGFTANTVLVKCSGVWPCHVPGRLCQACYPQVTWPFFEKLPLGWKQGFAPDPLQNSTNAALVLFAMLHIVAVQFSLHKQWEEEAPRKGRAGQTDRQGHHYNFSKVNHPYHAFSEDYWKLLPF